MKESLRISKEFDKLIEKHYCEK